MARWNPDLYVSETLTITTAVKTGILLLDRLSKSPAAHIPFTNQWRKLLWVAPGRPRFALQYHRLCVAVIVCGTKDVKYPYAAALEILGIGDGWRYGFDTPPNDRCAYDLSDLQEEWEFHTWNAKRVPPGARILTPMHEVALA